MSGNSLTVAAARTRGVWDHAGLGLFDRFTAFIGLILVAPVFLVLAVAIVIDSGFPVFFSQERLGVGGRLFRMYKFRKFAADIGTNTRPLTLANDSRCTRLGRFLEKTKLDELPQLWNILRGEMAIVGPRPEVPDFADCFIGPLRRVLDHRPGILGPSQAAYRHEGSMYPPGEDPGSYYRRVLFPAKAQLDLSYYPSRTFIKDLKWIFLGFSAVFGAGKAEHGSVGHQHEAGGVAGD